MKKLGLLRAALLSLALAAGLAACGGGQDQTMADTVPPAQALSQLQARAAALVISGVAPEEAAQQLMDTAETSPAYREYFPSRETTQSLPPFAYRFYPATGVYLGVVVTDGMGFDFGRVYLMGGPFGTSPMPMGMVTDYVTPTAPEPTDPISVPVPEPDPATTPVADFAPACTSCGATGPNSYAGTGIGIWQKTNTTGTTLDVPVSISGLNGQEVALVFTNESDSDAAMPPLPLALQQTAPLRLFVQEEGSSQSAEDIAEFNRRGWAERLARQASSAGAAIPLRNVGPVRALAYAVGSGRSFYHTDGTYRDATLRQQAVTSDGLTVNFWVENSEFGPEKVTSYIVGQLAGPFTRVGGVYDMLKAMGGPLWGPHIYTNSLIPAASKSMDIVLLNQDRNGQGYGTVGYFWALHNMSKSVDSRSNESLTLFLDTETLYLGTGQPLSQAIATLAHEGMHMSNYYRRSVLKGASYAYETWLEEMTALQMEDAAALTVTSSYHPVRDSRMRQYLSSGSYNCTLVEWSLGSSACNRYALASTFGGFLLRHLGVDFFKSLLDQPSDDSLQALQNAIQERRPGATVGEYLRRFAASTAAVLPATAPEKYGFPALTDSGFTLPAIDVSQYKTHRKLPLVVPAMLESYANFPVVRSAVRGTYSETVRVPVGSTLTVVVR